MSQNLEYICGENCASRINLEFQVQTHTDRLGHSLD